MLRKIYAPLREETSLVRRYVLRALHQLTKSMRLFDSPSIQQVRDREYLTDSDLLTDFLLYRRTFRSWWASSRRWWW